MRLSYGAGTTLRGDKRKKDTERRRWELVVRLVQVTFGDGNVME